MSELESYETYEDVDEEKYPGLGEMMANLNGTFWSYYIL